MRFPTANSSTLGELQARATATNDSQFNTLRLTSAIGSLYTHGRNRLWFSCRRFECVDVFVRAEQQQRTDLPRV